MGKVKEYWAKVEREWELMEMECYYDNLLAYTKSRKRRKDKYGKVDSKKG